MGDNGKLVRRWFDEVMNQGRTEAIDELLAPDAVIHGFSRGGLKGREAFRAFHSALQANFSDIDIRVERTVEDGESVSAWCRVSVTHRDSGTVATFTGATMGVIRDGQIQEGWNTWDFLGLLTQIGAVDADRVGSMLGA